MDPKTFEHYSLRSRQLLRFKARSSSLNAIKITEDDIRKARRFQPRFRADTDNTDEEDWPQFWSSRPQSLTTALVHFRKAPLPPSPQTSKSLSLSHTTDEAVDFQDRTCSVGEDPLESWYSNVGYLTALDTSAIDVLEQVLPLLTMSTIKKKLYKSKGDRAMGLDNRNVRLSPCQPADPFLTVFRDMQPLQGSSVRFPDLHEKVEEYHVVEWELDLKKAIKDELEATFQRTVMMSMLDRFRLMYSLKDDNLKDGDQTVLDFAVESTWNCPFMPTRALKKDKPDRRRVLSRPRPDISIAFHLGSIIEEGLLGAIPEATKRMMIYEAQDGTRTQRAFHFLMIEAKNADKSATDKDGQLQILNSASQSLHCLYEFFNEADRQEVECKKACCTPGVSITTNNAGGQDPSSAGENTFVGRFFREVRVFTAVPAGRAITIYVHRACPASKLPFPSDKGRPPFQLMILPDYPLQFEYNELIKLTNDGFNRGSLVDTFKKIMVDYGIGQLRPLLRKAALAIATKFYKWEEKKGTQYVLGMRHYSHGQTAPASPPASQAVSQGTQRSSASAASSSQPRSPNRRASSRGSASSQVAHLSFAGSQLGLPKSKKRKL